MIEIKNKSECTGCGACRDICPTGAICLCADEEGFLYPKVDLNKCVACNKCDQRCPVAESRRENAHGNKPMAAYAVQSKNQCIRKSSSSGGAFSEIATYILEQNGVVFGAAFDENLNVRHVAIEDVQQLSKLRGSKYVQSEIGDSYIKVKSYLEAGRLVLFSGTPCQIGGLQAYLRRDYSNLITQDIICHGVPSSMVWQKYIQYRERKAKAKVRSVSFRDKRFGWKLCSVWLAFEDGAEYVNTLREDLYMRAFLNNICLRPSCYQCAFKTKSRASDLTLADYWGVGHVVPELDDDKGTSLVLIHSEKGKALFEAVQKNLHWQETDPEAATQHNSAMLTSVPHNQDREAFISDIAQKGFQKGKRFLRVPLILRIKQRLKRKLVR